MSNFCSFFKEPRKPSRSNQFSLLTQASWTRLESQWKTQLGDSLIIWCLFRYKTSALWRWCAAIASKLKNCKSLFSSSSSRITSFAHSKVHHQSRATKHKRRSSNGRSSTKTTYPYKHYRGIQIAKQSYQKCTQNSMSTWFTCPFQNSIWCRYARARFASTLCFKNKKWRRTSKFWSIMHVCSGRKFKSSSVLAKKSLCS